MLDLNFHAWANTVSARTTLHCGRVHSLRLLSGDREIMTIYANSGDEAPGFGLSGEQLERIAAILNERTEAAKADPVALTEERAS